MRTPTATHNAHCVAAIVELLISLADPKTGVGTLGHHLYDIFPSALMAGYDPDLSSSSSVYGLGWPALNC